MFNKKIFLGILAIALLALGGTTIARADNENEGNKMNGGKMHEKEAGLVGSSLEVHISDNGKVLVRGAKVTAISGSTITATTAWGSTSMTWAVNTDSSSKLLRRFGGSGMISEIAVGDIISFQGMLVTTVSSPITVVAKTVKDWSIQKKNATFEGTVSSISGTSFVLATKNKGNITVNTSASTQIMKNGATGVFADIIIGGKAGATGIYNNLTNTLESSKVMVKTEDPKPMSKEGKVKSVPGTTAPTTFVMTSGGTDYTVKVATSTSVVNNNWLTATLASFAVDNQVRVYGVVNTDNSIDATVVRNTSL